MEDEKLAAYYDDLTRRGGGAARFKQGLGFSSTNDDVPSRGSALPTTSSSFLSSFVKASSPSKTAEFDKQEQLQSIQNKLSKKPKKVSRSPSPSRISIERSCSRDRVSDKQSKRRSRSRSPSRDQIRDRHSKRTSRSHSPSRTSTERSRSRSRSRSRDRVRDEQSKRRSRRRSPSGDQIRDRHSKRTSRSRSRDRYSRRRSRSRDRRSRRRYRSRSRSRSRERSGERSKRQGSPVERRPEKGKKPGEARGGGRIDFAKLIDGYDNMTPAEKVKAKMKLQLSKTAENDVSIGKGSGWERFDFDKDAPLDDEEIEGAEDDAVLVKHIGQSFRFSAVEARKEEEMKAVHDEAMFGTPMYSHPPPAETDDEAEDKSHQNEKVESVPVTSLLSDQVLTMQKGSWRDRARKP